VAPPLRGGIPATESRGHVGLNYGREATPWPRRSAAGIPRRSRGATLEPQEQLQESPRAKLAQRASQKVGEVTQIHLATSFHSVILGTPGEIDFFNAKECS